MYIWPRSGENFVTDPVQLIGSTRSKFDVLPNRRS